MTAYRIFGTPTENPVHDRLVPLRKPSTVSVFHGRSSTRRFNFPRDMPLPFPDCHVSRAFARTLIRPLSAVTEKLRKGPSRRRS
jgi:hypothetical protein